MANLLVTGGAGFIGANFVRHCLEHRPRDRIVVLDALTYAGNLASLAAARRHPGFRFVHADISDQTRVEALLREEAIDTLVNLAAETHVDRSIRAPDAFIQTNIVGTHALLKAAKNVWIDAKEPRSHRFHHVSTDEVFGSLAADAPAFEESSPYAPNSPYSASKAAADHLVRAYRNTYGLSTTVSYCCNNYGPFHFPEKLIPLAIVNLLRGIPLPVYGDGRQIRDWLHVEDHCRAIGLILERGRAGETYNIGGACETDNLSLLERLCDIVDERFATDADLRTRFPDSPAARGAPSRSLIELVADRPGHDRRYALDGAKASRELGFHPIIRLREGLQRTFDWFATNEGWWRSCIDGSYREPRPDAIDPRS